MTSGKTKTLVTILAFGLSAAHQTGFAGSCLGEVDEKADQIDQCIRSEKHLINKLKDIRPMVDSSIAEQATPVLSELSACIKTYKLWKQTCDLQYINTYPGQLGSLKKFVPVPFGQLGVHLEFSGRHPEILNNKDFVQRFTDNYESIVDQLEYRTGIVEAQRSGQ